MAAEKLFILYVNKKLVKGVLGDGDVLLDFGNFENS